ncbi:MAG: glycosyltransferase family 4 protein [Candidatus Eremiobacteraeota bacterium]|nr:glycosyltransferase family 4 protein [Candidatus Eremiobacteraeota bacterium]
MFGNVYSVGHFHGVTTYNKRFIKSICDKVDLHLLCADSGDEQNPGLPGIRWGEYNGLPSLFAQRDERYVTRFSVPGETREFDRFVEELAAHIRERDIALIHLADWEDSIGIASFAAAGKAGIPWILSPVDYRLICGQVHLFEKGIRPCTGPDSSFNKCARCIATSRVAWGNAYTKSRALLREILYALGLRKLLHCYHRPESWRKRYEAIKSFLPDCSSIVCMSRFHAHKLQQFTGLDPSKFKTIYYAAEEPGARYSPDPERFTPPLRIGWMNSLLREWGFTFLLEAWKRSGVPSEKAQLVLYLYPGTGRAVKVEGYESLVREKKVVIMEERVLGQEDKVFSRLSAFIIASLWHENGTTYDPFIRKVPFIAPDIGPHREIIEHGINGFLYRKADINSLASLIRSLADDPAILKKASEGCLFSREYGHHAWGENYLELYTQILAPHGKNQNG